MGNMSFEVFMNLIFYWSGIIESGNNHLRLHVTERINQLSPNDVIELTKRIPDWKDRLEEGFWKIQDANEAIGEIGATIDEVFVDRGTEYKHIGYEAPRLSF
ncbi:MAG: hypothetical protein KAI64_02005 [Thermoplasmata archaeon]|nr:hypothetical protein [Thermoplasmata archaeon]